MMLPTSTPKDTRKVTWTVGMGQSRQALSEEACGLLSPGFLQQKLGVFVENIKRAKASKSADCTYPSYL